MRSRSTTYRVRSRRRPGVALGHGRGVFPVERHPPVFHDAGIGENRRPARDSAQNAAVPGLASQPLKQPAVAKADRVAAGDDEREVVRAGRIPEPGDRDRGRGRAAQQLRRLRPGGEVEDFVYPSAGQQIGRAQGFGHRREGHQGEALHQNEGDAAVGEPRLDHGLNIKEYVLYRNAFGRQPAYRSDAGSRTSCAIRYRKSSSRA